MITLSRGVQDRFAHLKGCELQSAELRQWEVAPMMEDDTLQRQNREHDKAMSPLGELRSF
jgi:hypothetical protein